jgi:hypothetical protein
VQGRRAKHSFVLIVVKPQIGLTGIGFEIRTSGLSFLGKKRSSRLSISDSHNGCCNVVSENSRFSSGSLLLEIQIVSYRLTDPDVLALLKTFQAESIPPSLVGQGRLQEHRGVLRQ